MTAAHVVLRQKPCRSYFRAQPCTLLKSANAETAIFDVSTTSFLTMYFVLGSIVIVFASFFGYVAKQIAVGKEKPQSASAEEPGAVMRRSVG
jgi:hypothetical protein